MGSYGKALYVLKEVLCSLCVELVEYESALYDAEEDDLGVLL